jgi:hypothetical protein
MYPEGHHKMPAPAVTLEKQDFQEYIICVIAEIHLTPDFM